jgi:DNA-binding MarR family transcriptional regulator
MRQIDKLKEIEKSILKFNNIYDSFAKRNKLDRLELDMYLYISRNLDKNICQSDLAQDLYKSPTTISSLIKKEINKDLICLILEDDNKKNKIIKLTRKGEEFLNEVIIPFQTRLLNSLNFSDNVIYNLVSVFSKIEENN